MKKFILSFFLMLGLGGCAETQTVLGDIGTALGTVGSVAATASNNIPALCSELNQLSTTISQSGAVTPAQASAIQAGQNHYDTYCGPVALDASIISLAASQLQADIAALQSL